MYGCASAYAVCLPVISFPSLNYNININETIFSVYMYPANILFGFVE